MQIRTDIDALYAAHLATMTKRFERVLRETGKGGFLIPSGSQRYVFLDDRVYPFVANAHFKSFLPLTDTAECFLLLRDAERPTLFYHQPEDYWHLPPADPSGYWVKHWDIHPIQHSADIGNLLGDVRELIFLGEETDLAKSLGINAINPAQVLAALHFDRACKTPYELGCMQLATNAAVAGHRVAEAGFRAGKSEYDIQHEYLRTIAARERETPYTGIVALNEHAATLHYQYYDLQPPAQMHSLLIDAGASFNGYAADITRTYSSSSGTFNDLITRMDEEQLAIINDIRVGMNYADLHIAMHYRLGQVLKDFDLVDMSPEAMVEANVTFTFLPHGLGHLLGLQTHDVAGFQQNREGDTKPAPEQYPALRLTRPIEEAQVFTIEPGLYFIPMLLRELKQGPHGASVNWSRIDDLMKYGGIRIEDNIAVVDGNPVNLTRNAFGRVS